MCHKKLELGLELAVNFVRTYNLCLCEKTFCWFRFELFVRPECVPVEIAIKNNCFLCTMLLKLLIKQRDSYFIFILYVLFLLFSFFHLTYQVIYVFAYLTLFTFNKIYEFHLIILLLIYSCLSIVMKLK